MMDRFIRVVWGLSKKAFRKWWFYPVLVAYLLIGVKVGSLSYKVYNAPGSYGYATRFVLYPVSTVFLEGWICNKGEQNSVDSKKEICVIDKNKRDFTEGYFSIIAAYLSSPYERAMYIGTMSFWWALKIFVNFVSIVLIFLFSIVAVITTLVFVVVAYLQSILMTQILEMFPKLFLWLVG